MKQKSFGHELFSSSHFNIEPLPEKDQVEVFGRKDQQEKKERKDSDSQIIQPSIYYFL
jgi:hypothetical protein